MDSPKSILDYLREMEDMRCKLAIYSLSQSEQIYIAGIILILKRLDAKEI